MSDVARLHLGLDEKTNFSWLIDDVAAPMINGDPGQRQWLLDSVRKARQLEHFRNRFANASPT
jgi:hypothetical protein